MNNHNSQYSSPRLIAKCGGLFATIAVLAGLSCQAGTVLIDFDSLLGMPINVGTSVPVQNRLSNQLLATTGASFSSGAGYVAVVAHAPHLTVSMPNVIGGTTASGALSFGTPVTISFFDPSNAAVNAVTDFVSIRGDMESVSWGTATMEAFGISGLSLGKVTAPDTDAGLTLTISRPGIHSVVISQYSPGLWEDGTIGYDNLMFHTVQPVPEPGALSLLLVSLGGGALAFRRQWRFNKN